MKRQVPLLLLVALACGAAGFYAYRQLTLPAPTIEAADMTATTTAAPEGPEKTAAQSTVPETVPEIHLPDLQGKLRSLKEFGGQPVIINFWATWCVPCRREIPLLNHLYQEYHADKRSASLGIVGIAVDFPASVADYVKTTKINYQLLVGEQEGAEAAAKFGMELVLPFSVFVDSADRIVAVKVGELHRDEADAILTAIRQLDDGKVELATARQGIAEQLRRLSVERAKSTPQIG